MMCAIVCWRDTSMSYASIYGVTHIDILFYNINFIILYEDDIYLITLYYRVHSPSSLSITHL